MTATLPKTAPFSADEIDTLNRLVARTSPLQRSWLSGFLAGLDAANDAPAPQPVSLPRAVEKLVILYGSETGNAEGLALKARKAARKLGFDVKAIDMADVTPETLAGIKNLLVIASTWGEGDPPQRAAAFYKSLMADSAPRLPSVRFAVLALGDTAYANFCATGRAIDERLAALGAIRVAERIDLDLDYAKQAAAWTDATLAALAPEEPQPSAKIVRVDFKAGTHAEESDEPAFDAESPLAAEIADIVNLNGTGSSSETYHVELSTDVAGWSYQPGDAIGVVPANDPALVAELIDAAGVGSDPALARRLIAERDITTLTRPLVAAYAKLTGRSDVAALAVPDRFVAYAADRQIIDLFAEHREQLTAEQLTALLRPLPSRLYSVASSPAVHPGETHLLVSAVRWHSHDRARNGVASTWLAGRKRGDVVNLFVKPNRHFRLPKDASRPIVMIGAGTGIAPFRAFVEERVAAGSHGKSWLFFGGRNYTTDFLYQLEWQDHLASGALSRIDVAFSRDQPEKIYVQHRIADRAIELKRWIADGGVIYVCGDEKGMARDVEKALAAALGGNELDVLCKAGRYLRDVY
jgi:sulfite reductase (NADPH) flavoprotein alpha-component